MQSCHGVAAYCDVAIVPIRNTGASQSFRRLTVLTVFWPLLCAECVCGRCSAPDPAGGAYSAPQPLSW